MLTAIRTQWKFDGTEVVLAVAVVVLLSNTVHACIDEEDDATARELAAVCNDAALRLQRRLYIRSQGEDKLENVELVRTY